MRLRDPHERRVVGTVTAKVALAGVDVADEGRVRVAPSQCAGRVTVRRATIRSELGEYLVLAHIDALMREGHRGRGLLAAQGMVLVVESRRPNHVRGVEHGVYRTGRGGRDAVQVRRDPVELARRGGVGV